MMLIDLNFEGINLVVDKGVGCVDEKDLCREIPQT